MSEQTFTLVATFAQGEVFQAVLKDETGQFYLLNPTLGTVLVKRTQGQIDTLLASGKSTGLQKFTKSIARTMSEIQQQFGAAPDSGINEDLTL